jgi:galacturan 1,4-alpha-galacturonidase
MLNTVFHSEHLMAQNITFSDFLVQNVDNPITINQCYSTPADICAQFSSNVNISDVHFFNVHGTSSGSQGTKVVDMRCSQVCEDITAENTNIASPKGPATYQCVNVESISELDFPC